jgi:uncharacterized YceG family protein
VSAGYGGGAGGPWRPTGDEPQWDDSGRSRNQPNVWSQDQDGQAQNGQGRNGQAQNGQAQNGRGQRGQNGSGHAPVGNGSAGYAGQNYGNPGYGAQDYDGSGYGARGYGQPGGQPGGRPAAGSGPSYRPQEPSGYDQRGPGPRGVAAGYGDEFQPVNSQRGDPVRDDRGGDSFLPGFGGRDEFDGPPDLGGNRGQGRGRDRRGDRPGRYPEDGGYDDPRGAGTGRRDDRDPRDPAAFQEGRRPDGRPGDGRRPDGRAPDGRGYDQRDRDERQSGSDNWDMRRDRPRRKATRWVPRILLLVIFGGFVAGALVGGLFVYHKYEAKYHPADYVGAGIAPTVTVQVQSGETPSGLAATLVQLGIVESTRAFTIAAEKSTSQAVIEPGFFTLNHHMQASLAYAALLNPKNRVQLGVTIPEGKRASQVALILSEKTKIPLKNFQQVIDHPAKLGLPPYANGKVEGYLFPATYPIVPHETALQILQAMVARFNAEATVIDLPAAAARVHLTAARVITEASMAQAEGGSVSDFPKIAEVITNRLKIGQHLQFDSTVVYGLGKYSTSATFAELKINTPYNTYLHAGLPAGPISNPGDAAIQAILHPDTGDFLYFLTVPGGKSQFSPRALTGQ